MRGWKSNLAIVAATLFVASWVGYRSERRTMDAAGKPATTFRSVVRQVMAPKSRKDSFAKLHELRHRAGRSVPTPRERQECWEIVRGFTAEDVQAFLAEIPDGLRRPSNYELVNMLFFRWTQVDPEAAMNVAKQPPYAEGREAQYIVGAVWVERDMEGALRWVKAKGDDFTKSMIEGHAGLMLARQDPEHALVRAKEVSTQAEEGAITALAAQMSGSRESRRKLFEMLAGLDEGSRQRSINQLCWHYMEEDRGVAMEAVTELEESGLPPEQAQYFRNRVLQWGMADRPQERLEMLMRPETNAQPEAQLNGYAGWVAQKPEEAVAWATEHGKVDFISEIVKRQSYEYIRSGWQPGDATREWWERGMRLQIAAWKQQQPEAVDDWLNALPTDVREHFKASPHN